MGTTISRRLKREINRFNAENRAHKYLDKGKFKPAPMHPTTLKHIDDIMPDQNEIDELSKKHSKLDDNLKNVYLKSFDPPNVYGKPSQRNLPTNRSVPGDPDLGYFEPEFIPEGKFTLKQAMQALTLYQEDPLKNNVATISQRYKLSITDTENFLKYFSNFKLFMPEPKAKGVKQSMKILKANWEKPLVQIVDKEEKH